MKEQTNVPKEDTEEEDAKKEDTKKEKTDGEECCSDCSSCSGCCGKQAKGGYLQPPFLNLDAIQSYKKSTQNDLT